MIAFSSGFGVFTMSATKKMAKTISYCKYYHCLFINRLIKTSVSTADVCIFCHCEWKLCPHLQCCEHLPLLHLSMICQSTNEDVCSHIYSTFSIKHFWNIQEFLGYLKSSVEIANRVVLQQRRHKQASRKRTRKCGSL